MRIERRTQRALDPRGRGVWLATLAVLVAGAVVVWIVASPGERQRRKAMERLELGDDSARVVALLGTPPARCPAGSLDHLRSRMAADWPPAVREHLIDTLRVRTADRWIYPLADRGPAGCTLAEGDTEIGIGADRRVLWYVALSERTMLRVSDALVVPDSAVLP